jgi:hypothetical protein
MTWGPFVARANHWLSEVRLNRQNIQTLTLAKPKRWMSFYSKIHKNRGAHSPFRLCAWLEDAFAILM